MQIGGIIKNSFIDYPEKIAYVVFTSGCNFNCFYCHNFELINNNQSNYKPDEVLKDIEKRKNFIDSVVISGGEPTLQPDLADFIKSIKALGLYVKLDTNGTNPELISSLLLNKLIDYIAMDIKAPIEKYDFICQRKVNTESIMKSIDIIMNSGIDYEFRTTVPPELDIKDLINIVNLIKGAKQYIIQEYKITTKILDSNENKKLQKLHSKEYLEAALLECKPFVKRCLLRAK